jgi:hypothetical protein
MGNIFSRIIHPSNSIDFKDLTTENENKSEHSCLWKESFIQKDTNQKTKSTNKIYSNIGETHFYKNI